MANNLPILAKEITEKCTECSLCQKECTFLQKYGNPKVIADKYYLIDGKGQNKAFECSLCGLCAAVCPAEIDPSRMFLEMRWEAVSLGQEEISEYQALLNYEKRGISKRYTWYGLPRGCDTVLFPGCALPGTRPETVLNLFEHLRQSNPNLGIVLDCCIKPSLDLGRQAIFRPYSGK